MVVAGPCGRAAPVRDKPWLSHCRYRRISRPSPRKYMARQTDTLAPTILLFLSAFFLFLQIQREGGGGGGGEKPSGIVCVRVEVGVVVWQCGGWGVGGGGGEGTSSCCWRWQWSGEGDGGPLVIDYCSRIDMSKLSVW